MECYQNVLIFVIVSLATSQGAGEETTTVTSDNDTEVDTEVSVHNDTISQLDRLFFQQEIPDEYKSTIPSMIKELDDLSDEEFLEFLKKAADRAKQSYDELTSIHDQLEKNLTSIAPSQRLKKRCHGCHKKRFGFMQPMPVFVPIAIPVHFQKSGGGCGGGCGGGGYGGGGHGGGGYGGGGHGGGGYGYQQPQVCHSCGGGGYGGGGGGGGSFSSSSASASSSSGSASWRKK